MRKACCCFFVLLVTAVAASAQPRAMEGVAAIQGKKLPAAVLEIPYSTEIVESAVEEYFAKKGYKATKSRDYQLFRNVSAGSSNTGFDVYVKADRKSRKEKESSVVYFVMGRPNEVLSSRTVGDNFGVEEARDLLNDFIPHLEDYNLRQEIAEAEESLKKMEKKQAGLLSDSTDLAKRRLQLDEKIQQNSTAMQTQAAEIEKQRLLLEATRGRRKQP